MPRIAFELDLSADTAEIAARRGLLTAEAIKDLIERELNTRPTLKERSFQRDFTTVDLSLPGVRAMVLAEVEESLSALPPDDRYPPGFNLKLKGAANPELLGSAEITGDIVESLFPDNWEPDHDCD